ALTHLTLPTGLGNLTALYLNGNQLSDLTLAAGLTNLTTLFLYNNQLTRLTLPADLARLSELLLSYNYQLTNLTIPPELRSLNALNLSGTHLASLTLPATLTSLTYLDLQYNRLTKVAIPAGIHWLYPPVVDLRNSGVQVTLFPVLKSPQRTGSGDFNFELFADTGTFSLFRSTDLKNWTSIGSITITTPGYPGNVFTDMTAHALNRAFYEVRP